MDQTVTTRDRRPGKPVKALHALDWFFGNICVRKCPEDLQALHYARMREIIRGHEDFPITHKMLIKVIREKHRICDLPDDDFRRPTRDFYKPR